MVERYLAKVQTGVRFSVSAQKEDLTCLSFLNAKTALLSRFCMSFGSVSLVDNMGDSGDKRQQTF